MSDELTFYGKTTYLTPKECEAIYKLFDESDCPLKDNIKNKIAGFYQSDETYSRAQALHKKRKVSKKNFWRQP